MMDESFAAYKERVRALYDRAAPVYGSAGIPFFEHAGRRLSELAGVGVGERVLDVATGRGAVLFAAAERVGPTGSVLGIDLSGEMVRETGAEIRARGLDNASVVQMDAERVELPDASFDVVLSSFAVFFFPRLERVLVELQRVLRPGGRIGIAHGGAEADPRWRWEGELLRKYPVPDPMNGLPDDMMRRSLHKRGDLTALLSAAGYVAVQEHLEWAEFTFRDADDWWAARWTHGSRVPLEQMTPEQVEGYRRDALAHLGEMAAEGPLTQRMQFLYAIAERPGR